MRNKRKQPGLGSRASGLGPATTADQSRQQEPPSREQIEAEIPQAPARETIPEPEPIGGQRGPKPQVEKRED